jgi:hypothetical protein
MSPDFSPRERRWLLLVQDGSHSWLGRTSDPSEDEITAAGAALERAGVGGYLAVSEGDYWSEGELSVLWVRDLAGASEEDFQGAVEAFHERRRKNLAQ